jgi:hypothetical protein
MYRGKIVGEFAGGNDNVKEIGLAMAGVVA